MKNAIVLGMAFGDEGKGVTTQWLCKQSLKYGRKPIVVRFNGGAQAAHTIHLNGKEHICSTYGSGVLLGVPTFLSKDFFFDPNCAYNEYLTLADLKPTLFVHPKCRVVTPYDVYAGICNEKVRKDGSCGKGIFQTFNRYVEQPFQPVLSRLDSEVEAQDYLESVRSYYGLPYDSEAEEAFIAALQKLPFTLMSKAELNEQEAFSEMVFEGAQGLLLDMDFGFYPNVTPSHTGLDNLKDETLHGADVYLVTRTYTTRHGNGYEPQQVLHWDLSGKHETNVENEFQGKFKTGILDFDLIQRAVDRHHLDAWQRKHNLQYHLMVTHGDLVLSNGFLEYIWHGESHWEEIHEVSELKRLFIKVLGNFDIRFLSIRVNASVESDFQ